MEIMQGPEKNLKKNEKSFTLNRILTEIQGDSVSIK